jgi:hypothetical protein
LRNGGKIEEEEAANDQGFASLFDEATWVVTSLGAILDSQFSSAMIRHGPDRKL